VLLRGALLSPDRPRLPCELFNGGFRKGRQRYSTHARARKISYDKAQWMSGTDLVIAVGNREHDMCAVDAAAEEFEQIERSLVCPMHVFENNQRRGVAFELVERSSEYLVPTHPRFGGRQQGTLCLTRNVMQRGQRSRCEERIACTPQHPRRMLLPGELLQQ
jgi:hypothetical protein